MSDEFVYLMHLLASASRGVPAREPQTPIDWERLEELAKEQRIETLIACALKMSPEISCPAELRSRLTERMLVSVTRDYRCQYLVMQLLREMEEAGIHVLLLKGKAVARYYAAPECRISSDTDLLIDPADEERACRFMAEKGFSVEPRWQNGHHAVCVHPLMGYVELHVQLYDEIVEEIWFGRVDCRAFVCEPHKKMLLQEGMCNTLGDTDNLIFLTLHMIKHFILSGMSLRMLMDVSLFYSCCRDSVDYERFWSTMRSLKYDGFVECVFWAAIQYCGFDLSDFPMLCEAVPGQVSMILDDLEAGGWLGFNDHSAREEGWHEYNRQILLREKSEWQYKIYMIHWRFGGILKKLFPSREVLKRDYPFADDGWRGILFAWFLRLFDRIKKLGQGVITKSIVSDEKSLSDSGRERLRMFRELGML